MAGHWLSPTNSAICRACNVRVPIEELHHHGGHLNYRCKDAKACAERAEADDPSDYADDGDHGELHDLREVYRGKGRLAPGEPFGLKPINPECKGQQS